MARPSLRPEEIESFRERLCEVALRTYAEEGYQAVTLRGLAEKLGCSHATPYRYFADKAEIFALVCARGFERFADALERAAASSDEPEERIRAIGRAYLRFAVREPHAYRIMFEIREPEGAEYPEHKSKESRSWRAILDAVDAARRAGVLEGDAATLAHELWAAVHGIASLHLAGKLNMGRAANGLLDPMIDALIAGHRPRSAQRRKP